MGGGGRKSIILQKIPISKAKNTCKRMVIILVSHDWYFVDIESLIFFLLEWLDVSRTFQLDCVDVCFSEDLKLVGKSMGWHLTSINACGF